MGPQIACISQSIIGRQLFTRLPNAVHQIAPLPTNHPFHADTFISLSTQSENHLILAYEVGNVHGVLHHMYG